MTAMTQANSELVPFHAAAETAVAAAVTADAAAAARGAPSTKALWAGRILGGIVAVLLAMDAFIKLARVPAAVEGTAQLGFPPSALLTIGVLATLCLVLYLIPRTAIIGAILWTGYFGGAIATHIRMDNPLFTHTLSPVYVSILLWGSLWLRDRRVSALFAPRASR